MINLDFHKTGFGNSAQTIHPSRSIQKSAWNPWRYLHAVKTFTFLSLVVLFAGCQKNNLPTGYGRAAGDSYYNSVNGTLILHEMIEASGHDVDRYSKFSPRWEKYDTVFWIPDSFRPPGKDLIAKIDGWLSADQYRTLVYVARDFDAAVSYWDLLATNAPREPDYTENEPQPESSEDLKRKYHHASTKYLSSRYSGQFKGCDWYDIVENPPQQAKTISGTLTSSIDTKDADLRYATLPAPGTVTKTGEFGDYSVEVLMSVDSQPFVYSLEKSSYPDSQMIVVGNASFLLNLPLINETNRKIAMALIEHVQQNDFAGRDVLFIESDEFLPISDQDSPEIQSKWQWITKEPLRYIVPNILFCCLLFCFVYFPIFGRPKRIARKSTANFNDHIDALGNLLRKSKARKQPGDWIEEYRRRSSRSSRQNNDET